MLRMARTPRATGQTNLCLAGGVALNCVGNGKLLREGPFENIWIQPAAGDAGGALGRALFVAPAARRAAPADRPTDTQHGSLLGPAFATTRSQAFLESTARSPLRRRGRARRARRELMADEKVVGWFQGRMEFGPRALGSRSIIGDARSAKMQT